MKKSNLLLLSLLACFIMSCSNDSDNPDIPTPPSIEAPNEAIEKAFLEEFKDAKNIKWEKYDDYYIANFEMGNVVKSSGENVSTAVWYDLEGNNYLTEDFIEKASIPQNCLDLFNSYCMDDYGFKRDIISVTRGRYKGTIFYKILSVVPQGQETNTPHPSIHMCIAEHDHIEFIDEPEEGEQIVKTTLPELYAMKFIDSKYDDYVLIDNGTEEEEKEYWVGLMIPGKEFVDLAFHDYSVEKITIDHFISYDLIDASEKSKLVNQLATWGYTEGSYEFTYDYCRKEDNFTNGSQFSFIETEYHILVGQKEYYHSVTTDDVTGVSIVNGQVDYVDINSTHKVEIEEKLNALELGNYLIETVYVSMSNKDNQATLAAEEYSLSVTLEEDSSKLFTYEVKSGELTEYIPEW